MILFLYGEDSFTSQNKLHDYIAKFKKTDPAGMNLQIMDVGGFDMEKFKDSITAQAFMGQGRMVVLKNFLSSGKKGDQELVMKFLDDQNVAASNLLLFFESGELDKRKKLFKYLKKQKSQEFKRPQGGQLNTWVREKFATRKRQVEPQAVSKLVAFVGDDLWQMYNEIDKLSNYAGAERAVTASDVEKLVHAKLDDQIFHLVDALGAKNKAEALRLLHEHLDLGEHPLYIFTMIVYQFRNLITIVSCGDSRPDVIAKETGMHPYVVKKTLAQSRHYRLDYLQKIYAKLLDIERKMKREDVDELVLLDTFVVLAA